MSFGEIPRPLPTCTTWFQTIEEGDRCPECDRKDLPDQFGEGSSRLQRVGPLLVCKNGHGPICTIREEREQHGT